MRLIFRAVPYCSVDVHQSGGPCSVSSSLNLVVVLCRHAHQRGVCVQTTDVNMASQEEDNKLECNSNVNKDQERNFVNVYKKYERTLRNKYETFDRKIASLIEVWKNLSEINLSQLDITYVLQIMNWAKLHALNIVLTAEWKDYKGIYEANLLTEIEKAQIQLKKLNVELSTRCEKLAKVVRNPWEDEILTRLLSSKNCEIGPEEIEFFCVETAYLVSVRLKKLCESQCEDLALNLVTAFMSCNKLSKTQNFSLNAAETQIWFIFDTYIALLYKFNDNQQILQLLKDLSLDEGLQLIRRFAKKRVKISKIWKHCHRIAILASQVFVSCAAMKFAEQHRGVLENLLDCFLSLCTTDPMIENFTKSLRRISQLADAAGLYVFCEVVHRKAGLKLKPFTIEMYIRALTTDMNNLERQKNDNETEKVAETSKRLADAFCKLSEVLNEYVEVSRECTLTAFSLVPTKERLKRIEELARRSGFEVLDTGQEWKCKYHPPVLPSDDVVWICPECNDWMCKPQVNYLKSNTALLEALTNHDLGISPQLCDDLVVCLSNPRYQVLSWLLGWDDLHRFCIMYLNDPERTKNIITDLKFVDIDYSIFKSIKREPVDELAGIERGYEQYLDHDFFSEDQNSAMSEDSESQDSRPYSLGSDGAGDAGLAAAQNKSNPTTLKSLRMFRPTLKRPRNGSDQAPPAKVFKNDKTEACGSNSDFYINSRVPNSIIELNNSMRVGNNCTNGNNSFNYSGGYSDNRPIKVDGNVAYNFNQETASKNGLVATLPPHGGQVATTESCNNHGTKSRQHQPEFTMRPAPNTPNAYWPNGTPESNTKCSSPEIRVCLEKLTIRPIRQLLEQPSNSIRNSTNNTIPSNLAVDEFSVPCNTFKGVSVQDVIKCDEKKSGAVQPDDDDLSLRNLFDGQNCQMKDQMDVDDYVVPKQSFSETISLAELSFILNNPDCEAARALRARATMLDSTATSTFKPLRIDKHSTTMLKELRVVLTRVSTHNHDYKTPKRSQQINKSLNKLRISLNKSKTSTRRYRRRKNVTDKSENKLHGKAPRRVQKYKNTKSPLQDINPRVPSIKKEYHINSKTTNDCDLSKPKSQVPVDMNPRVMLERLPDRKYYSAKSILANVPGLNDYEMLRPGNVEQIVNVVQISGGRTSTTVPAQNTQTSTQVTPHIQRIGQPRNDKPEQTTNTETSTTTATPTTTTVKPTTSQPSTLINILSQQIIRPGQSNCVRTRPSPLINILSQQIIRPTTTQVAQKIITNSTTEQCVVNNVSKTTETTVINSIKNSTTTTIKNVATPTSGQGTILQFICKSSLPKFQQAFGKSVYNSTDATTTEGSTTNTTDVVVDSSKKAPPKNIPVNVQPIPGGVIYTRQMPVGQTINLIPPGGRGQVFRIATSNADQISLVKDTVIHSKMSALLAAALQGKQKTEQDGETNDEAASGGARVTVTRPTLVQNARIVKPVQIPSNVIRTSPQSNLSSTTLEQLREFDMVYKQIKERSSTSTPAEATNAQPENNEPTSQRISVTYVNQGQKFTQLSPVVVVSSYCNLQPAASPALSVTSQGSSSPCVTPAPTPTMPKVVSKSSKGKTLKNTTTHTSKSSPIPKPQQKPQEDEHTTQRIFDILAEYAEQLRNSPDLNNKPAPRRRSNPPTNPNQNSKRKKSSGSKKSGQCSSMSEADTEDQRTMGSEDSSCGVVQLSVQDDDQPQIQSSIATTESNDSSTSNSRQLILTETGTGNTQTRNLIIADSSVGEALKMPNTAVLVPGNYIMPVSMVKGGQQIAVVSGGSKILATVPARSGPNMLLFQSFLNQTRKTGVSTVKYSTIQPLSGISSQSLAGVSAQPPVILPSNSHNLTAVTLGQPLTIKKVEDAERGNTELLLTISQPAENATKVIETVPQPDSSTSLISDIKIEETVIQDCATEKVFHTYQKSIIATPIATPVIAQTTCIKEEVEESVSQNLITMNITSENIKDHHVKTAERVQSVLVTACTSNGPMLSHTPPRYRKPSDSSSTNNDVANKDFLHNGDKNSSETKHFQGTTTVYYTNKTKKVVSTPPQRLDREIHQLCLQRKQQALERELRLQKTLSEECEDLGVDEPSTSDLFPEADLLFDSNHSPSFDQTSQDIIKRPPMIHHHHPEIKDDGKATMTTLFSDDDNSSSLRTDLFEYVEYQTTETELEFEQNQQLTNGQSSTSNESGSSCEDNTLLQNCASMSDVTLNSPISPDLYTDNTPPSLNKYKFKYSNRKKGERHKPNENWTAEVSSSEDTTGSTELVKSGSHSPEPCTNKLSHSISCEDELSDGGSYKVVRVAISKTDLLKDEESCEELHCDDDLDCSPSGRGARRSVKKMCSCCNGSQDGGASRKRPHTPSPHKKAFLNKKR